MGPPRAQNIMTAPRTKVLWFGSDDFSDLQDLLSTLAGLQLIPITSESKLIEDLPSARAVVFEFDGNSRMYIGRIRRTKEVAVQNGTLIVLINGQGVDKGNFQVAADFLFKGAGEPYGPEGSQFRPIREFLRDDLCFAAHAISIWKSGPISNPDLKIKGKFNADHEGLLKRAFSDFTSIDVTVPPGGRSGAKVYRVVPREEPRAAFLAKIDETGRIAGEVIGYAKFASKAVSFNCRPNIDPDRTLYTPTLSILVEDFLAKAKPLFDVLPQSTPAVLVSSIFDGALQRWRRSAIYEEQKSFKSSLHVEKILKRKSPAFFAAAERSKKKMKAPFDGNELLAACDAIESSPCTWNWIHGDLNAGNVYVLTGSSDIVLIDFTNTDTGPMVLDPACLEVDLVFNRAKRIYDNLVYELYRPPLWLPSIRTAVRSELIWLVDSVQAIRMFGLTDLNRQAYTFAIACYLIRHASFEDSGTPKSRALAMCVASRLIDFLSNEKR